MIKIIVPDLRATSAIFILAENMRRGAIAHGCDNVEILSLASDFATKIDKDANVNADDERYSQIIAKCAEADAIIFGSQTYFGLVSAEVKAFFDATVDVFCDGAWRNKIAAGFTHSGAPSGDKLSTISNMSIFAAQHGMIWIGMDLQCNETLSGDICRELDIEKDMQLNRVGGWLGLMTFQNLSQEDLATARYMGYRVAHCVKRMQIA